MGNAEEVRANEETNSLARKKWDFYFFSVPGVLIMDKAQMRIFGYL